MSGVSAHAALARRLVDILDVLDGDLARFLIDVLAVGQLLLDHVDFGDVLEPARPFAGLQADDAAHDLGEPWSMTRAPASGIIVLK